MFLKIDIALIMLKQVAFAWRSNHGNRSPYEQLTIRHTSFSRKYLRKHKLLVNSKFNNLHTCHPPFSFNTEVRDSDSNKEQ